MLDLLSSSFAAKLWRIGRTVLPLAVVGYLGYDLGQTRASGEYQVKLASLQASHAESAARHAQQTAANLAAADTRYRELNRLAHQVGVALLQTRADLATAQRQLKQRIPDATRTDGPRFTGLGPDSLRLYRQLLGYSAADPAADLPSADTGNAGEAAAPAGAAAGLPPDDLLKHAADYGAWCQQLDQQLNSYISLHQQAPGE